MGIVLWQRLIIGHDMQSFSKDRKKDRSRLGELIS